MSLLTLEATMAKNHPGSKAIIICLLTGTILLALIHHPVIHSSQSFDTTTMLLPGSLAKVAFLSLMAGLNARTIYERPSTPNAQIVASIDKAVTGNSVIIPGGSPFFYLDDPAENVFVIDSISMTPTPCVIGAKCAVLVTGSFKADFEPKKVRLNMDIEMYLPDGDHAQVIAADEDLCEWADVRQGQGVGSDVCKPDHKPLKNGEKTTIEMETDLVQGFVTEAIYYIDLKLLSGEKQLVHLGAKVDLKPLVPDGRGIASSVSTS